MSYRYVLFCILLCLGLAACTPTRGEEGPDQVGPISEAAATEIAATEAMATSLAMPAGTEIAAEATAVGGVVTTPVDSEATHTVWLTEMPEGMTPNATEFRPTDVPPATATPVTCPTMAPAADLPSAELPLVVAYLNEGNLWLWEEEAGVGRPLTESGSVTSFQFVPDGNSIAFVQAGDVWWWDEGGTTVQLTSSGDVHYSLAADDGAVVAFVRAIDEYQQELWAINSDGTNLRQLVSAAEFTEMGAHPDAALARMTADGSLATTGEYKATVPVSLQWQPGSHNLVFDTGPNLELFNPGGIGEPPDDDTLWRLDVDSGERSLILPHGQAGGYWGGVLFSPDGRTMAIVTNSGISLAHSDGTNRRDNLVSYPSIGLGHTSFTPRIYWSADSQYLRTIVPNEEQIFGAENPTFTVWQIPLDSPAFRLATFSGFPLDVTLSPDLMLVAFWKPISPQSNIRELHIASVDGAWDVVYATGDSTEFKSWSADSRHFVYWFFQEQRPYLGQLCEEPVPLVEPVPVGWLSMQWLDPSRFLFLSGQEGEWMLSLGTAGGAARPVVELDSGYYEWRQ